MNSLWEVNFENETSFHSYQDINVFSYPSHKLFDEDLDNCIVNNFLNSEKITRSTDYNTDEKMEEAKRIMKCEPETYTEKDKTETVSCESSNLFDKYEKEEEVTMEKPVIEKISSRKLADDSIRKKIKIKAEEWLKSFLNKHFERKYPGKDIKFKKMPQNFLKNVSINLNGKCLEMIVEERYQYDFEDASKKKLISNTKVIRSLNELGEKYDPDSKLKVKLKDLYQSYFRSKKYKQDLMDIEKDEGQQYAKKYHLLARGKDKTLDFIEYYLKTPGNKNPKTKKGK